MACCIESPPMPAEQGLKMGKTHAGGTAVWKSPLVSAARKEVLLRESCPGVEAEKSKSGEAAAQHSAAEVRNP